MPTKKKQKKKKNASQTPKQGLQPDGTKGEEYKETNKTSLSYATAEVNSTMVDSIEVLLLNGRSFIDHFGRSTCIVRFGPMLGVNFASLLCCWRCWCRCYGCLLLLLPLLGLMLAELHSACLRQNAYNDDHYFTSEVFRYNNYSLFFINPVLASLRHNA